MAAINFCDSRIGTHITVNKVEADGHHAQNLLQKSPTSGPQRGFLAETFVRPPVDLALHFPCNIDIDRVIICGRVSLQCTCTMEVSCNTSRTHVTSIAQANTAIQDFDNSRLIYYIAGYAGSRDSDTFCFQNPNFCALAPYSELCMGKSQLGQQEFVKRNLRFKPWSEQHNISHLSVKLTRTRHSGPPAVGWLEVWAQPAKCCPPQLAKEIVAIHSQICKSDSGLDEACHYYSEQNRTEESVVNINDQHKQATCFDSANINNDCLSIPSRDNIPVEFLDSLTDDLMSLPVLLPSGHTIDQKSLERHNAAQAQWGRPPSDPFTGLTFSGNSQPVSNTSLKFRLDAFLLHNGHLVEVKEAGRTLGRNCLSSGAASASTQLTATSRLLAKSTAHREQQQMNCRTGERLVYHCWKTRNL